MTDEQKSKFITDVAADLYQNKFERFQNREQFEENAKDVLIKAEVSQLFEDEKIDLVTTDNGNGCELVDAVNPVTKKTARVLILGNHCRYAKWRELYDSL